MNRRVKFASQADPETLGQLRAIAAREGRQLQSLIEEALRDYVEFKRSGKARRHVMDALRQSMGEHDPLYRELAK
jgi:predicted transcriptional regulator